MNKWIVGFGAVAFLLGLGAIYLSAQVFAARSTRLREIAAVREQSEQVADELLEARLARDAAKSRVTSLEQNWGRVYQVPGGDVAVLDPQRGIIDLPIGSNAKGFRNAADPDAADRPMIHLYAVEGPQSRYLGQFMVNTASDRNSTIQLARRPLPGETQSWQAPEYRVRTFAPSSFASTISEISTAYELAEEAREAMQASEAEMGRQKAAAEAAVAGRLRELAGDPSLPEDAPEVLRKGLVASLAEAASDRDATAAEVAALRQTYWARQDELNRLLTVVREKAGDLPQASETPRLEASFSQPRR